MSQMNAAMNEINWLISLLVAIPLSIAGNLLTPIFLNWRARRSKRAATKRLREVSRDYLQIQRFANDPMRLNTYLLLALLISLLLFAVPAALAGLGSMIRVLRPDASSQAVSVVTFVAGFTSAVLNLNAVIMIARTISICQKARNFERHQPLFEAQIEELKSSAAETRSAT